MMVLLALLDTGGYVCFNLGVGHAATAVVAAASAPYAVVPDRDGLDRCSGSARPGRQWLGVGFVIAGVIVLGAVTLTRRAYRSEPAAAPAPPPR